jgi:cell division protein FtsB
MRQFIEKYRPHLSKLADIRVLGQIVFVVIVLLISWSGVKVIHTNYQLQQQIARVQQENEIRKLQNENQKLKNDYYNSPQYLELSARQNFGLAAAPPPPAGLWAELVAEGLLREDAPVPAHSLSGGDS